MQVQPPPEALMASRSQRIREAEKQRLPGRGQWPLHEFHRLALEHARAHEGIPPRKLEDLGKAEPWVVKSFAEGPYGNEVPAKAGPPYAILPDVVFEFAGPIDPSSRATNHVPYAVELHPIYADGKHWVLYADGKTARVVVDPALLAKHGLVIEPLLPDPVAVPAAAPEELPYQVYAIRTGPEPATFVLRNLMTGKQLACSWDASQAQAGTADLGKAWATGRVAHWARYLSDEADAPILRQWVAILSRQYGVTALPVPSGGDAERR